MMIQAVFIFMCAYAILGDPLFHHKYLDDVETPERKVEGASLGGNKPGSMPIQKRTADSDSDSLDSLLGDEAKEEKAKKKLKTKALDELENELVDSTTTTMPLVTGTMTTPRSNQSSSHSSTPVHSSTPSHLSTSTWKSQLSTSTWKSQLSTSTSKSHLSTPIWKSTAAPARTTTSATATSTAKPILGSKLKSDMKNNAACSQPRTMNYIESLGNKQLMNFQQVMNTSLNTAEDPKECRQIIKSILAQKMNESSQGVAMLMCIYSFTSFRVHFNNSEILKKINNVVNFNFSQLKEERGKLAKQIIGKVVDPSAKELFRLYLNNKDGNYNSTGRINGQLPVDICKKEAKHLN